MQPLSMTGPEHGLPPVPSGSVPHHDQPLNQPLMHEGMEGMHPEGMQGMQVPQTQTQTQTLPREASDLTNPE
ncbi:hypothetical protein KIPB_015709, partial [Kipferlia bialata]|eukprot:g15709.t1